MSVIARISAALALTAASLPAAAQQQAPPLIDVPAGQPFVHANSGITLPATLGGLARLHVREYEAPQLDVNVEYATADRGEDISVYVFRSTTGSAPVWFDRAAVAVESRPLYGSPARLDVAPAFTPPGQSTASGMIAVWSVNGDYRSTALAVVPMGEWLVKFRYSSRTLDAAALDAKLRAVIAALGWPAAIAAEPAAVAVVDCVGGLKLGGRAKPAKVDAASAMFGGLLAGVKGKPDPKAPVPVWCRDATKLEMGGVYRVNAAENAYLIALSDSGRGVLVGPNGIAGIVDKTAKPSWTVDLVLPGRTISYPAQDRLPPPEQTLQLLRGPAMSSTNTWGQKREVQVSPNAFK